MFRNCLAAALRHLARNRLYTTISVVGLAIGLCTALIAALVIHNQYTYDHFIPGYDRTYAMILVRRNSGLRTEFATETEVRFAAQLALTFRQLEATTRALDQTLRVRHGAQSAREVVYWVDPNFFDALPLKFVAGDARTALRSPDGVVLSRQYARKFFGQDAPIGETLEVGASQMVVRGIIDDPPPNATDVQRDILAAGIAKNSRISQIENDPRHQGNNLNWNSGLTYLRLEPGASIDTIRAGLPEFLRQVWPRADKDTVQFVRIDRLNTFEPMHPGFRSRVTMFGVIGAAVLFIAGANFVNLLTARSVRRAREVAIRKLAGAGRGTLIVQFLGEAMLQALVAAVVALALTEWLLPQVNAFLDSGATLDYMHEPWYVVALLGVAFALGALAGSYPAFVVSAFRPAPVLRGGSAGVGGSPLLRRALVTLQFALLLSLAICAGIVERQRTFAAGDALRLNADQVLVVSVRRENRFVPALFDELRKLPGVLNSTRTGGHFLGTGGFRDIGAASWGSIPVPGHDEIHVNWSPLDFDAFDFYGVSPLAGTLPKVGAPSKQPSRPGDVVLNATAARRFGFADFSAAIGSAIPATAPIPDYARSASALPAAPPPSQSRIVAVVPDFSLSSVEETIPPIIFYESPGEMWLANLRVSGHDIPETLAAIAGLWKRTASTDPEPPVLFFLDELVQSHYLSMLRQAQAFGIGAGIAVLLACVGLFALTAATAERCMREIGIRKALGADTTTIVRLLLWQFSKPVVWSCLLAWPVAGFVMRRWLGTFAYHIDLPLWLFTAAAVAALLIALATVSTQSVLVARARPVEALRYE